MREEFFSVLIKSERSPVTGQAEIKEVYRIQLPGNPVLGEGKPENQNHAIIFTRGENLQTIDMNQSNYFEEALKMRNLLEEFDCDGVGPDRARVAAGNAPLSASGTSLSSSTTAAASALSPPPSSAAPEGAAAAQKRVAIVGFREHIYTGGLSSIANFMALQEGWYVPLET